jgi:zinc protease
VEFFDLGLDYPDRYPDLIRNLTRDDISRVAEKYLDPESLVTVLVGNQKKIGDN